MKISQNFLAFSEYMNFNSEVGSLNCTLSVGCSFWVSVFGSKVFWLDTKKSCRATVLVRSLHCQTAMDLFRKNHHEKEPSMYSFLPHIWRSLNLKSNYWWPQFFQKKTERNSLSWASSCLRRVSFVCFLEELRKPQFVFVVVWPLKWPLTALKKSCFIQNFTK